MSVRGVRSVKRCRAFVIAALLSCLFLGVVAASASALSLGLVRSGHSLESIGKSGATLLRAEMTPLGSENGANWSAYDAVVGKAAEEGLTVLPMLQGRLDHELGALPSAAEKSAYETWMKQAVRRYGYNGIYWSTHPSVPAHPVFAWELWNEPNNSSFGTISAESFGSFLAWAGLAVQTASESWGEQKTGVISGGLLAWSGGTNYQTYFGNAYKVAGVSTAITGVAFHPYELDTSLFPGKTRLQAFEEAVQGARTYLNTHGASGKSLWITETAWPAEAEYGVGTVEQANLLRQSFSWAKTNAESLDLHAIVWYLDQDLTTTPIWQERCGLKTAAGAYREAWFAFQEEAGVARWPIPGPDVKVAFRDAGNANSLTGWQIGSTGWQQLFFWGHEVAPGTRPVILRYGEATHVFFVDANRGNQITEWAWNSVTGWQQNFIATDPVAAGSSPSGIVVSGQPQIYFADAAHSNSITLLTHASGWSQVPFYGDSVAAGSSPSAVSTPGSVQIYFADASHSNTITAWVWGSTLTQHPFYGDSVAAGSSPSAIVSGGSSEIYFADASQSNTLAAWVWGSTLSQVRFYGDPIAAGSSPSAITTPSSIQIYFSDEALGGSLALWEWGSTLTQTRLYGHPAAVGSSPNAAG